MSKYCWVQMSKKELLEFIGTGDPFQFQFKNKDYLIEGDFFDNEGIGRVGSYMIQNPNIQENGDYGKASYYLEDSKYKTAKELLEAKFLDEKTIIERYDLGELRFFDN